MTDREAFDEWWSDFTSIHEDWKYADSEALRFQAWQAARATAPAWHPAPTVPGLWLCRQAITDHVHAYEVTDEMAFNRNLGLKGVWYGPIPQEPAP